MQLLFLGGGGEGEGGRGAIKVPYGKCGSGIWANIVGSCCVRLHVANI